MISPKAFPGDLRLIYNVIRSAHEDHAVDIDPRILKELVRTERTLSRQGQELLDKIIEEITETSDAGEELVGDLLVKLNQKTIAREIAQAAINIDNENGQETFQRIKELVDAASRGPSDSKFQIVSTEIEELLEQSAASGRWKWSISSLAERVPAIGPKMNVIIFGRPEVGKSSFVAHEVVGFMKQGAKVLYVANEEPGFKVMLNLVRATLGVSDADLARLNISKFGPWNNIKSNITLLDATETTLGEIDQCVGDYKPDIVVLDQTDKVTAQSKFEAGHERLKDLYVRVRFLCRKYENVCLNVSQASADAEGQQYVPFHMLDMSKTGKAGEADVIIGIGKDPMKEETYQRYLTVSKNKLPGGGWHGMIPVLFSPEKNSWIGE